MRDIGKSNMRSCTYSEEHKHPNVEEKRDCLQLAWNTIESKYGIVLGGFLKTRYVDRNKCSAKFSLKLKPSWKLRYWRLSITNDGLIFEKSRRADSTPYKSILLPFGKTSFWQNWGKRGDTKYRFGFTLRVACNNMQIDVAVDSERVRCQWMNVLDVVFHNNVQHTKDLLECLNGKNHIVESTSKSYEEVSESAHVIPRRFPSVLYGDDGYMSNNSEKTLFLCSKSVALFKIFDQDLKSQITNKNGICGSECILQTNVMLPQFSNNCESDHDNNVSCCVVPQVLTLLNADVTHNKSDDVSHSDLVDPSPTNLRILEEKEQQETFDNHVEEKPQVISPTSSSFTLQQSSETLTNNSNYNSDSQLKGSNCELDEQNNVSCEDILVE